MATSSATSSDPALHSSEQVPEWAGAHLEPADTEGDRHPGRARGSVCDLAADTAPGTAAPQVCMSQWQSRRSQVCSLP